MLNVVSLQGRIIEDPNYRVLSTGVSYCGIVIAIERPKGSNAERLSDIIPCVAWGRTAEYINNYFRKGDMVVVSGHLQSRKYSKGDGTNGVAYEVKINECNAVDGKERIKTKEVDDIDWDKVPRINREF